MTPATAKGVAVDSLATQTAQRGHLGVDERTDRGRKARAEVPRSEHAGLQPSGTDPLEVLAAQDRTRLPELVPIRYGRMAASPFAFFRGAAAVMAADLAQGPRTEFTVQLCGDAHLSNFGFFASPERRLVFDLNDFDETLPGPFEWDVKRLVASLEIAGRDRGFSRAQRRAATVAGVRSYRAALRSFAAATSLDVWYARVDVDDLLARFEGALGHKRRRRVDRQLDKARGRDNLGALARFTSTENGLPRFVATPPLVMPLRDLLADAVPDRLAIEEALRTLLDGYRETLQADRQVLFDQYRLVDIARKVVGVGSVGTRSWMLLLLGRDDRDPLILQAKEAGPSVLEAHLGASSATSGGERVVTGQRIMQAVGDILLGWQTLRGLDGLERDFYVRQLRDWKGSFDVEDMLPEGIRDYGEICGWTLARAHARSGDRIAIAAYLGGSTRFDDAIVAFAEEYADKNERDHGLLRDAIAAGRVAAADG